MCAVQYMQNFKAPLHSPWEMLRSQQIATVWKCFCFIKLWAPNPSPCSYIHLRARFWQTLPRLKVLKSNWLNVTELCAESGPSHGKEMAESLDATTGWWGNYESFPCLWSPGAKCSISAASPKKLLILTYFCWCEWDAYLTCLRQTLSAKYGQLFPHKHFCHHIPARAPLLSTLLSCICYFTQLCSPEVNDC